MKFKILILFFFFSAIATVCNAQEGMTESGAEFIIITFALLCTSALNCFVTLFITLIPFRYIIIFGSIWVIGSSLFIIITHLSWFVGKFDISDLEFSLLHIGYILLNLILINIVVGRIIFYFLNKKNRCEKVESDFN